MAETYREMKDYAFPVDVLNIALVVVVDDASGHLETAVRVIDSLKVEQLRAIDIQVTPPDSMVFLDKLCLNQ